MFYDTSRFAVTAVLEQNWQRIYEEFLGVRAEIIDWRGKRLYDKGWKGVLLYDHPDGTPVPENLAKCPFTAALVREHIPDHGVVAYSVFEPQTRTKPHQDYASPYVRCHLPLEIPEGDCAIKVGDEIRPWVPGKLIMFDHTALHETWNLTDKDRVLLVVDFVPRSGEEVPGQHATVPATASV